MNPTVSSLRLLQRLRGSRPHRPPGFKYGSMEEAVLSEGHMFSVAADQRVGRFVAQPKQCFWNARRLAAKHPKKFVYVEGFAIGVIPLHHSWVVNQDGQVLDPTWVHCSNGIGESYVGIPMPLALVNKIVTTDCTSVLMHYEKDLPILKHGVSAACAAYGVSDESPSLLALRALRLPRPRRAVRRSRARAGAGARPSDAACRADA